MLASEARVQTDRSSRYLVQLCRHVDQLGQHLGHRPRTHDGADAHEPPTVLNVEWSDTDGIVNLSWGRWTMHAAPEALTLRVEADDPESLRRIEHLVAPRLQKIGRRDKLTLSWQPADVDADRPDHRTAPAATTDTVARRKRRRTIGLAVVAALAVALHLGLGGAALAGSRWTSLTTNVVLALVVLKVLAVGIVAVRRRRAHHAGVGDSRSPREVSHHGRRG